jgi:hypothetical protein
MKLSEGKNGMKCRSEGVDGPMTNPTIRLGMGLSILVGNQEPPGIPQEAHITDPIPSKKRVINIELTFSPPSALSCGIIAPYSSSPCLSSNQPCIYY